MEPIKEEREPCEDPHSVVEPFKEEEREAGKDPHSVAEPLKEEVIFDDVYLFIIFFL